LRPTNGVYQQPKVLRLKGKSVEEEVAVVQRDMPNFFVEALTVSNGRVFTETREVVVPPEKRVVNVEVLPSKTEYKPGEKATVKVKLTDAAGKPFVGSTVLTVYDRSVDYIAGGSNVPEIREFFWKWRRHHHPQTQSSLARWVPTLVRSSEIGMSNLGIFGENVVDETREGRRQVFDEMLYERAAPGALGRAGGMGGPGGPGGGAMAPAAGAMLGDAGAKRGADREEAKD